MISVQIRVVEAAPQLLQNISSKKTRNYSTWPNLCEFQATTAYTRFFNFKKQMNLYYSVKKKHTLLGIKSRIGKKKLKMREKKPNGQQNHKYKPRCGSHFLNSVEARSRPNTKATHCMSDNMLM